MPHVSDTVRRIYFWHQFILKEDLGSGRKMLMYSRFVKHEAKIGPGNGGD